ncbi:MAG: hypothetical protein QOJ02_3585 [Acidobacteriota bacterium]|nr:hypothetical protein [Acidobacteriota bacterium]
MKRCQTCGLVLDDSQTFCTNDGTPLIADPSSYDPQATLVAPPGSIPTTPPGGGATQGARTDWQSPARPTVQPGYAPQAGYEQPAGLRPGKFVPGLIGGLVAGILSLFVDFLPPSPFIIISFFCIVWAMIGGALASRIYINRSQTPVRQGEGAVVGLVAGAIAAVIYLALDTTIAYAIHGEYIEMVSRMQGQNMSAGAFFAMTGIVGALTIFGCSVVGGIIGVAMFEKRKAYPISTPPPPPPGFGGPIGGGYR